MHATAEKAWVAALMSPPKQPSTQMKSRPWLVLQVVMVHTVPLRHVAFVKHCVAAGH